LIATDFVPSLVSGEASITVVPAKASAMTAMMHVTARRRAFIFLLQFVGAARDDRFRVFSWRAAVLRERSGKHKKIARPLI
jgi:hypothetical protein